MAATESGHTDWYDSCLRRTNTSLQPREQPRTAAMIQGLTGAPDRRAITMSQPRHSVGEPATGSLSSPVGALTPPCPRPCSGLAYARTPLRVTRLWPRFPYPSGSLERLPAFARLARLAARRIPPPLSSAPLPLRERVARFRLPESEKLTLTR